MKTSNSLKPQKSAQPFPVSEGVFRRRFTFRAREVSAIATVVRRAYFMAPNGGSWIRRAIFLMALLVYETVASAACQFGEEQCVFGFVWRLAFPGDHVCVSGTIAGQTSADNAAAEGNHLPGSNVCRPGLVWREAEPDDQVCVPGPTRTHAAADNAVALSRREQSCKETMTVDSFSILTLNVGGTGGGTGTGDGGIASETRMRRVAIWAKRHRVAPDVIALQEVYGWLYTPPYRSCGRGLGIGSGDYDEIDSLVKSLQEMTGVTYRVAYLTGRTGSFGPFFARCSLYQAHAMLYKPTRLINVTQSVGGWVAHDAETPTLFGVPHVRRSLPMCNRGTNLMPLKTLMDGPPQAGKCGRATPSGPANVVFNETGHIAGSHVRFAFVHNPAKFIDVFNVHPTGGQEQLDKVAFRRLVDSLSPPPYAGASLLYPPLLAGDFNLLDVERDFPKFITAVEAPPNDVPRIGIGATDAFPAQVRVRTTQKQVVPDLPDGMLCEGSPKYLVSDHCGLFARFDIDGADAKQLRGVFVDGPDVVVTAVPFRLQAVPSGGGPNFTYKWQPGGETSEIVNGIAGTVGTSVLFSVTVTDASTGQATTGTHKVTAVRATGPTPHERCLQACSDQLATCRRSAGGGGGQLLCTEEAQQCRNDCPP